MTGAVSSVAARKDLEFTSRIGSSSVLCMCTIAALLAPSSLDGAPVGQDPRPTFRTAVDLLALEVQVVDSSGRPITGLETDAFTVQIDGRRRKVVNAEFVSAVGGRSGAPFTPPANPVASDADQNRGRLYVLAVDELSMRPDVVLAARKSLERFVDRLDPRDWIGVLAFPNASVVVDPTRDRPSVRAAIQRITGHYERVPSRFSLIESEIVGLTERDPDVTKRVAERECRQGGSCLSEILAEARALAGQYEALGAARLAAIRTLFERLSASTLLKTVVLLSGDLATANSSVGRPNLQALAQQAGARAAEANVALYILHFDTTSMEMRSARERTPRDLPPGEAGILGAGLELVRDSSKGYLTKIQAGTGDYAFDRVLRETSGHYVLGVQTMPEDRDGGKHFIRVEVRRRGAVVRHPAIAIIGAAVR